MADIPLLQNGCTAADIIDTINAIIARLTSENGVSISYDDLTNKPRINGVELTGDQNTADLRIAMNGTTDYDSLMETLATKAYADEAKSEAVAAAEAVAENALDSKLDKDLGNIAATSNISDDGYIPMVTDGEVKKVKMEVVSAYAEQKNTVNRQNTAGGNAPSVTPAAGSTTESFAVTIEPEDWQENDIWGYVAVVRDERAKGVRSAFSTPGTETLSTWSESPACLVAIEDGALVYASPKACPAGTLVMNVFCEK